MKSHRILLIACLYSVFMPICMDLYVAALPGMSQSLRISPAAASNLTFYMLYGVAVSMLFYGPLADIFGRRKIILVSLIITTIGAGISSCAATPYILVVGRIITGIGSGAAPVIARSILSDRIDDPVDFTHAISWYAMSGSISPALAPIIGGLIYVILGWRAVFIFLTIYSLTVFYISYKFLPETLIIKSRLSLRAAFNNYAVLLKNKAFIGYSIIAGLCFSYVIFYYAVSSFLYQNYFSFTTLENSFLYWISAFFIIAGGRLLQKLILHYSKHKIIWRATLVMLINTLLILVFAILKLKSAILFISLICISSFVYGIISPAFLSEGLVGLQDNIATAGALQAFFRVAIAVIVGILGAGTHNINMLKFTCVQAIVVLVIFLVYKYLRNL